MSKRRRFILTSLLLSAGFIGIVLLEDRFRMWGIGGLGLLTLGLFYWSLREGIRLNMTLLSLVLPVFFTVGVGLFWFLLPASVLARVPIVILYGLGIYTLCLTANIYTVAAVRTIALLRAARGVGFVLTLLTFFLIFDAILSLRVSLIVTAVLVAVSSLPLYFQAYWSVPLSLKFSESKDVFLYSVISSLIIGEVATLLFFWPVTVVVGSLFYTISCYTLLGLGQARLEGRLFKQTIREYLVLSTLVFIGMFLATRWV